LAAVLLTAATALVWHSAWGYWRGAASFQRQRAIYRTLFRRRWVHETIPRTLPVTAISGTLLSLAAWARVALASDPDTALRGPVLAGGLVSLALAFLVLVVFVPPLMLHNAPAFLVAPHDRGRPGGLALRRRYGGR
jgi:hypothetical protein